MENNLSDLKEKLKLKKLELEQNQGDKDEIKNVLYKSVWNRVDEKENFKEYHSKIYEDFYFFKKSDQEKIKINLIDFKHNTPNANFNLFSLTDKEEDDFLSLNYGFAKNEKLIYFVNFENKRKLFRNWYYIKLNFKKGSIYLYVQCLSILVLNRKKDINYYKKTLKKILKFEKKICEFYKKEYKQEKGILKWIEKRQK